MPRAAGGYGELRYQRLAGISVAHLYNLRRHRGYIARPQHWSKTRSHHVAIAVRKAPQPEGRAGYIRIDSVLPKAISTRSRGSTIPQRFAEQVNEFVAKFLNPYVNFHRPCLFPECHTNAKGKITKRYPQRLVSTPLEKLASLRPEQQNLKPGITLQSLQGQAAQHTDNQAAQQLNQARTQLFASINRRLKKAA